MDGPSIELRHQLARELTLVSRRLRHKVDDGLKVTGMSQSRGAVLYWLSDAPEGLSQTVLAERAGVEPASLVRTLDALQSQGLVERRPSPHDRRINLVRLTAAAHPRLEEIQQTTDDVWREAMDGIDPEELKRALSLLRRIRSRVDNEFGVIVRAA